MENFEHIPMISQPPELNIDLFPHQLASIYKMEELEQKKNIPTGDGYIYTKLGINGDITGYGKTLAMVGLILRDKMDWDPCNYYLTETENNYSDGLIKEHSSIYHEKIDTTLIVVNQPLVEQWEKEFSHCPLKVKSILTRKYANTVNAHDYDVIIITPTMYNRYVERYNDMAWKRFIFDEPGHIKVPAMRPLIAGFIWFVTATPKSILGKHANCRSSFMYKLIGKSNWYKYSYIFSKITISNDEKFIRQSWEMPPTHHSYYECFSTVHHTLNGLVSDRIFDMIDANNISGVITALGGNKTSNITDLVRNKKYNELEEIMARINIYTIRRDQKKIDEWKDREKRVKNQIEQLDNRFSELLKNDCNICFSTIISPVMEPSCQNIFCTKCLLTWLKNKKDCPLCRQQVNTTDLIYITSEEQKNSNVQNKLQTKENTVVDIIKKKKTGKFIIFSSFNETFNQIKNVLQGNNISFLEIKGTINVLSKRLQQFKEGKIQVIFLNSKYNGTGLNLQEATDVIIYHQMSDDILTQILGRPNRIGRTEPLQVHHLFYK